jgi:transcriptional regulator with XRE-family HTH domain
MHMCVDGKTLHTLRESKGLTLRALAEVSGISPAHLCKLENGLRYGSPSCRLRLATALGVDIGDISRPVPDRQPAAVS